MLTKARLHVSKSISVNHSMDSHKPGSIEPLSTASKKASSKCHYDMPGNVCKPSLDTITTKKGKVLSVVPKDFIPPRPNRANKSDQKDISPVCLEEKTYPREEYSICFHKNNSICLDQIISKKIKRRRLKINATHGVKLTNVAPPKRWRVPETAMCQLSLNEIMKEEKSIRHLQSTSANTITEPVIITAPEEIVQNKQLIKHLLHSWEFHEFPINAVYEYNSVELPPNDSDYIKTLFDNTMQPYAVTSIKRIVNPYLLLSYHLKKATNNEYEEKLLFHGTMIENVDSICIDNFDWRLVSKHKFGKGVSFSSTPCYAKNYQDNSGDTKVMFAAKVLVGSTSIGQFDTNVPQEPSDTTTDRKKRVYVKYEDSSFYPAYLINYKKK
ncbi:protein mono-ADP-ribosyltransferase TIPARP-like [Euwallacea fornicatus]|uniref:protein mono-ADP-ribosyltransferase TIPARP-like n=1 Tax=Euwallacea fornicatus TaxID=995702 RepID=UPI0033900EA3